MRKINKSSIFYPNYVVSSVLEIKPSDLFKLGITHIVFDIDETLVPKRKSTLSKDYIIHLNKIDKSGIRIIIGSNSRRNLDSITKHFNTQVIRPTIFSFKPLSSYYRKIIKFADTEPTHIAMVGDRIINDSIGANFAHINSILVLPINRKPGFLTKLVFRD